MDYSGVALTTPVSFGYTRASPHRVPWFFAGALRTLLERSGVGRDEVDGLVIASYRLAPDNAASLVEHMGMRCRFLCDLPYGGASGVMAARRAARAVQAGDADVVACLAADVPPAGPAALANFSTFSRDHVVPYGAPGPNGVFALITDAYMQANGATREQFGRLCVALRANGARYPGALQPRPLSLDEYLGARMISTPLGLYDCVMRCCGAEGFLVMSAERARRLGLRHAAIAGAIERHDGTVPQPVQSALYDDGDRAALWRQAGIGPADIDLLQAYDDYPVIVALQVESLGWCAAGEGLRFLLDHDLSAEGDFPLNTNGGMLAQGQAGAAGGFQGLTETLRQLTGEARGPAVPDARFGLVSCYGTVNYDRGLCASAAILTREAR
ncbi:MAG TPA: thiolase family protein [Burkholderiaceae bacterium]|nr:thiolase family protein [Burkholderiaceae bacterium]